MTPPDTRDLLLRAAELAQRYLQDLPARPVAARAGAAELLARLEGALPEEGLPADRVIEELVASADPGLTAMGSGRFFGWVIGGALPVGIAADWLTSTWDQNAGSAEATPAAAVLEQVALGWVAQLLDLPPGCVGGLVTGGQMANTVCLTVARHRVLAAAGHDVEQDGLAGAPAVELLMGAEQHDTVLRSMRLLGLGTRRIRHVPVDRQGRMRAAELAAVLRRVHGPAIVCAQAGNVNTGAFDPLEEIADAVDTARSRLPEGSVWLHVDGAFGLWARTSPALRAQAAGAERADSWATDAHKWLNTPYDCGVAITAHPEAHRRALGIHAAYLPTQDPVVRAPFDYTPELSRRARSFVLWATLRHLGAAGVRAMIERCCAHARRFALALADVPGLEILNDVTLNQVLVRLRDPAGHDDAAHVRAVIAALWADGTCLTSGTTWQGVPAMRISVSNWATDESDVDRSVAAIAAAHLGRAR